MNGIEAAYGIPEYRTSFYNKLAIFDSKNQLLTPYFFALLAKINFVKFGLFIIFDYIYNKLLLMHLKS